MEEDVRHAGLAGLFEDLEQQAAGLHLAERDAELVDRVREEYAGVTLGSRVHASLGRDVVLTLAGGEVVAGTLGDAGADWCRVSRSSAGGQDVWLVPLAAVRVARGLSARACPETARPAVRRLGLRSALYRLAGERDELRVCLVDASVGWVRLLRVGADFLEVVAPGGGSTPPRGADPETLVVSFGAVTAVWAAG